MNDVTTGNNNGRNGGKGGFPAIPGWDAATGLGTPDFSKLSKAAMAYNIARARVWGGEGREV